MDCLKKVNKTCLPPDPVVHAQKNQAFFAGRIVKSYNDDRLFIRVPNLDADWTHHGEKKELVCINSAVHIPCGAVHCVRGGRACLWGPSVGILLASPSVLLPYKKDAGSTSYFSEDAGSTSYFPEDASRSSFILAKIEEKDSEGYFQLERSHLIKGAFALDSVENHASKNREIAQRSCSHYYSWTSGHLQADGTFSQRKFRNTGQYYQYKTQHNETLLERIAQNDVVGIAGLQVKIIDTADNDFYGTSLKAMLKLREEMQTGLHHHPELPLVFFGSDPIHLRAIISPETMGYSNADILSRLQSLRSYAISCNINVATLGSLLGRLPPRRMLERLMSLNLPEIPLWYDQALALVMRSGNQGYWHQNNVKLPTIAELLDLTKKGADFGYLTEVSRGWRKVTSSLIEICLFAGTWQKGSVFHCQMTELLSEPDLLEKKQEIEQLTGQVIQHQLLNPTTITLSLQDLNSNPFAFVSLYKHGAKLKIDYDSPSQRGKLHVILCRITQGLSKNMADSVMAELLGLLHPVTGWEILNRTATDFLWIGSQIDPIAKKDPLNCDIHREYVPVAYSMMRHGAICELSDEYTQQLSSLDSQHPKDFKNFFGCDCKTLFQHLEQVKQANSPQHPLSASSNTQSVPPPKNTKTSQLVEHLFELGKPLFPESATFEQNVQAILETYYKAAHPKHAIAAVYGSANIDFQTPLRSIHDCDHVVRTALFTRVFLQLLKHQAINEPTEPSGLTSIKRQDLEELLQYAALYHDVVAENQDKNQEEIQSAIYLMRDLNGCVPDDILLEVAVALANKNVRDCDDENKREKMKNDILLSVPEKLILQLPSNKWCKLKERFFKPESSESEFQLWLRTIIRFGDTVDIYRAFGEAHFDFEKIELPKECRLCSDFKEKLTVTVKACWNLSSMTGGAGPDSVYARDMGLRDPHEIYISPKMNDISDMSKQEMTHNEVVRNRICAKEDVWAGVMSELLRMAKRQVAQMAGIQTASAADAAASGHELYHKIFDETDLDQVNLPGQLSELGLLWLSAGRCDWLTSKDNAQLQQIVSRLSQSGIQHPLGTLTEDTLKNEARTRAILSKRGRETWVDPKNVRGHPTKIMRTRVSSQKEDFRQHLES